MTLTADPGSASRISVLTDRLTTLRAERDQAQAETRGEAAGDVADRATNVEASIFLSTLDERIASLELEIESRRREHHDAGVVGVGDTVVLDFGDGPESFVVGTVEEAVEGVDILTPGSPLGRAVIGSSAGSDVTYYPRRGVALEVKVVSVG